MTDQTAEGQPAKFEVSVVTPVYNAARFVERAVESALAQPETGEVLLIEDNSPDNSLVICQKLVEKYEKVRLLRHPNGENRGAGASRNLGMVNASCEYIGFVDADNFYLPERFSLTPSVFQANPDCEGVYEAIGIHVENDAARQRWIASNRHPIDKLITLSSTIAPEDLGTALISGAYGGLTLDGFVIKRGVLQKSGLMSEKLRLHQDTDFIIRCALTARLYPGKMNAAVAMEGVHDENRFSAPRSQAQEYKNRMAYWLSLHRWAKEFANPETQKLILDGIIRYTKSHKYFISFPREYLPTRLVIMARLTRLLSYPEVLKDLLRKNW